MCIRQANRFWEYHEVIDPGGALESAAHGVPGWFVPGEVEGETSQRGELFRAVDVAVSLAVLVHGHGEHPVQGVFDPPMGTHSVLEAFECTAFSEINKRPNGRLAAIRSARLDFAVTHKVSPFSRFCLICHLAGSGVGNRPSTR